MTKFSKHLQNKKKIREKKRAKKLKNAKPAGPHKCDFKTINALTNTIVSDIEVRKDTQPLRTKVKKDNQTIGVSGDNGKHEKQSRHSVSVEVGSNSSADKTQAKLVTPTKHTGENLGSSPRSNKVSSVSTITVATPGDLKRPKNSNKRWKKLKAALQQKKKQKKLQSNEGGTTQSSVDHPADSDDEADPRDFKTMLLSKPKTISQRREKKREWRRQMKRLQKLKLKWTKEGKSNIEELVVQWRKEQHQANSDGESPSSEAAKSATEDSGSSNTTEKTKKGINEVATKEDLKSSRKVDTNKKVKLTKKKKYQDGEKGVEVDSESGEYMKQIEVDDAVETTALKCMPGIGKLGEANTQNMITGSGVTNKALQRLRVAQFRIINETLYTSKSDEAEELFRNDSSAFQIYHEGYRSQVSKWPINPLDRLINEIKRDAPRCTLIADLGCGDANLAKTLKPLGYKVHSFDLVSTNEHVTTCNVKNVPLEDGKMDVVVMCLSLMGTDMGQFVLEANRILKIGGTLKIAEVESRIPSVEGFIKMLKRYGFTLTKQNMSHNMFVFFDFNKAKSVPKGAENNMDKPLWLKACLYKKR